MIPDKFRDSSSVSLGEIVIPAVNDMKVGVRQKRKQPLSNCNGTNGIIIAP
jgi:hypothetical protein